MARIETDPNYSSPTFSRATAATDLFKKEDVQNLAAAMSTHDHSTGKGVQIAIPAGYITNTMLAANSVGTTQLIDNSINMADIAVGAVTQEVASFNSSPSFSTTTVNSQVDTPLAVASFPVNHVNSRLIMYFSSAFLDTNANCLMYLWVKMDGVARGIYWNGCFPVANVTKEVTFAANLGAGFAVGNHSITIAVQHNLAGTLSLGAIGSQFWIIEEKR